MLEQQTMLDRIKAITMDYIAERANAIGVDKSTIRDETDVFGSGILDSMALIELVTKIESETGCELDFAIVDPDALGSLASLINELGNALELKAA